MNSNDAFASAQNGYSNFSELFKDFFPTLYYFAKRLLKDHSMAEEVVSEVFMAIWGNRKWEKIAPPAPYLYRAVANSCQKKIRDAQTRFKYYRLFSVQSPIHEETILQEIYQAEAYRELYKAIETLPTQCRKVITLSFKEGLKVNEIAECLQISPSSVKTQRARGILMLRKILSQRAIQLLLTMGKVPF